MDQLAPVIPSAELLAALGRALETNPTLESTANLRLLFFQPEFSWQAFVELAVAQDVLPAFIFSLNKRCLLPPVPTTLGEEARVAHVTTRLASAYQQHLRRQTDLREQLIQITSTLNRENIIPILLKGAVHLTTQEPGWHQARSMRDIDILVRTSDVVIASQVLASLGYCAESNAPPIGHHLPKLHLAGRSGAIEIHTEALAFPACQGLSTEEVWSRAQLQDFASTTVRVLPPEWHLLHGMLHHQVADRGHDQHLLAVKGLWEFAMVGSEIPSHGWQSIIKHAGQREIMDVLASWLVQANRLFGLKIPDALVISNPAVKHAEATFRYARAPHMLRSASFLVNKLRYAFTPKVLAIRYRLAEGDSVAKAAVRHLVFLVHQYWGLIAQRWLGR